MKISQTATLFFTLCAAPQFGLATTDVDLADNVGLASLRGTVSNSDGAHRKLEKRKTYTCDCEDGSWGEPEHRSDGCLCEKSKTWSTVGVPFCWDESITITVTCEDQRLKAHNFLVNNDNGDTTYNSHRCGDGNHMNDGGCDDVFDFRVHSTCGHKLGVRHVRCKEKSKWELKNSGYTSDGRTPESGSLLRCEGDCDFDSDCGEGLKCFQRPNGDQSDVPGCYGTVKSGWDYCVRENELIQVGIDSSSLGHCEGDCDNDGDCGEGMKCFQRDGDELVPGCVGGEFEDSPTPRTGWDYCVKNEDMP